MELHSYAKTRSTKKWTIDQKRKLVENRITLDVLFNKKSFNLVDSWLKLIKVSDFACFDIQYVRNQWINILSKYKNLVERHTNDSNVDINEETRDLLTSEWEFFDKIYRWIKYKAKLNQNYNYNNIISEEIDDELINQQLELFSTESSTDDDIKRKSAIGQQQKINLNSNLSLLNIQTTNNNDNNNNLSSPHNQNIIPKTNNGSNGSGIRKSTNQKPIFQQVIQRKNQQNNMTPNLLLQQNQIINSNNLPNNTVYSQSNENSKSRLSLLQQNTTEKSVNITGSGCSTSGLNRKSKKLHKRKLNKLKNHKKDGKYYKKSSRKIERKFNTLCNIFAQIVEKDYPHINVTSLLHSSDDSTSSSD